MGDMIVAHEAPLRFRAKHAGSGAVLVMHGPHDEVRSNEPVVIASVAKQSSTS